MNRKRQVRVLNPWGLDRHVTDSCPLIDQQGSRRPSDGRPQWAVLGVDSEVIDRVGIEFYSKPRTGRYADLPVFHDQGLGDDVHLK